MNCRVVLNLFDDAERQRLSLHVSTVKIAPAPGSVLKRPSSELSQFLGNGHGRPFLHSKNDGAATPPEADILARGHVGKIDLVAERFGWELALIVRLSIAGGVSTGNVLIVRLA